MLRRIKAEPAAGSAILSATHGAIADDADLVSRNADGVPDCSGDALTTNEIIIERDVVVLLNVKIRQGASAATVACHYRVLNIYEKYYNKWFMLKQPYKKWKKEPKPYKLKLKVRLLNKNVLQEYCDADLGEEGYGKDDIFRIAKDSLVLDVVGRFQQGFA